MGINSREKSFEQALVEAAMTGSVESVASILADLNQGELVPLIEYINAEGGAWLRKQAEQRARSRGRMSQLVKLQEAILIVVGLKEGIALPGDLRHATEDLGSRVKEALREVDGSGDSAFQGMARAVIDAALERGGFTDLHGAFLSDLNGIELRGFLCALETRLLEIQKSRSESKKAHVADRTQDASRKRYESDQAALENCRNLLIAFQTLLKGQGEVFLARQAEEMLRGVDSRVREVDLEIDPSAFQAIMDIHARVCEALRAKLGG